MINGIGSTLLEKSLMKTDLYHGLDQTGVGGENVLHTGVRREWLRSCTRFGGYVGDNARMDSWSCALITFKGYLSSHLITSEKTLEVTECQAKEAF